MQQIKVIEADRAKELEIKINDWFNNITYKCDVIDIQYTHRNITSGYEIRYTAFILYTTHNLIND